LAREPHGAFDQERRLSREQPTVHVLLNATSARLGGGLTTLRNLLRAFSETDGGTRRYTVVARADMREAIDPMVPRVSFVTTGAGPGLGRVVAEQLGMPLRAAALRADVMLSPASVAVLPSPIPQILMFRNMAPFDPDVVARSRGLKQARLRALRAVGIASARTVQKVVFISEYARNATVPQLGIDPARALCIHLGRTASFSPAAIARAPEVLSRSGIEGPYILAVGDFYSHKNFIELVIGFSRARCSLPNGLKLVVAGTHTEAAYTTSVRRTIAREGLEDRVILTGQFPYRDLPALCAAATLFVFPSCCESFPNILVEGLSSGVPTLSSSAGPMPEIAGDGAEYFDPSQPDEIAAGIVRLLGDRPRAEQLARRGLAQAARFSWEATALRLGALLDEAAG